MSGFVNYISLHCNFLNRAAKKNRDEATDGTLRGSDALGKVSERDRRAQPLKGVPLRPSIARMSAVL